MLARLKIMKKLDTEADVILDNIAEAVIESKKTPPKMDQDPFEFYVERVQSGLFSKEDLFRSRFIKGYHTLVNELSKDS